VFATPQATKESECATSSSECQSNIAARNRHALTGRSVVSDLPYANRPLRIGVQLQPQHADYADLRRSPTLESAEPCA
jgi:hypothetical protein